MNLFKVLVDAKTSNKEQRELVDMYFLRDPRVRSLRLEEKRPTQVVLSESLRLPELPFRL